MEIIKRRERVEKPAYALVYYRNGYNYDDGGFSFPAREDGTPIMEEMTTGAKASYDALVADGTPLKVRRFIRAYSEPAIGECTCGEHISLTGDVQCPRCKRWYNAFAQELAEPRYWRE